MAHSAIDTEKSEATHHNEPANAAEGRVIHQVMVAPWAQAETHRLSGKEVEKLNAFMRSGSTSSIELKEATLLLNEACSTISSIASGGSDLQPISIPHAPSDQLSSLWPRLHPTGSLRLVTEVSLGKLATLYLGYSDSIALEIFGFQLRNK